MKKRNICIAVSLISVFSTLFIFNVLASWLLGIVSVLSLIIGFYDELKPCYEDEEEEADC